MLFPISAASEEHRKSEGKLEQSLSPNLYYMKQVVGNACGTVGILHAVLNSLHRGVVLRSGSFLERMHRETVSRSPDERADWLGRDEELDEAQEVATSEGQSAQISHEEEVNSVMKRYSSHPNLFTNKSTLKCIYLCNFLSYNYSTSSALHASMDACTSSMVGRIAPSITDLVQRTLCLKALAWLSDNLWSAIPKKW